MAINSIGEYPEIISDSVENFHGNQLVAVDWDDHRAMAGCPSLVPLPPEMLFSQLISELFPTLFAAHPDWKSVDWDAVQWNLDGSAFEPRLDASLKDNGVGHKSLIRFKTPGLNGYKGSLN